MVNTWARIERMEKKFRISDSCTDLEKLLHSSFFLISIAFRQSSHNFDNSYNMEYQKCERDACVEPGQCVDNSDTQEQVQERKHDG